MSLMHPAGRPHATRRSHLQVGGHVLERIPPPAGVGAGLELDEVRQNCQHLVPPAGRRLPLPRHRAFACSPVGHGWQQQGVGPRCPSWPGGHPPPPNRLPLPLRPTPPARGARGGDGGRPAVRGRPYLDLGPRRARAAAMRPPIRCRDQGDVGGRRIAAPRRGGGRLERPSGARGPAAAGPSTRRPAPIGRAPGGICRST
jgi:hypothetical protein